MTGGRAGASGSADLGRVEASLERLFRLAMGRRVLSRQTELVGATVSRAGYAVLRTLDEHGPLAMKDLARRSAMDPAVAARQVGALDREGLVEQRPHERDGRVRVVQLTAAGRKVFGSIVAVRTEYLSRAMSGWAPKERQQLVEVVDRLVRDLQREPFGVEDEPGRAEERT